MAILMTRLFWRLAITNSTVVLNIHIHVLQKVGQATGDIIKFYNEVFVPSTKSFLLHVGSNAGPSVPNNVAVPEERNLLEGTVLISLEMCFGYRHGSVIENLKQLCKSLIVCSFSALRIRGHFLQSEKPSC